MSVFELRAKVDYPEHGILAGDLVAAERADSAAPGDLVVALVDGVATVRRFEAGVVVLGRVLVVAGRRS